MDNNVSELLRENSDGVPNGHLLKTGADEIDRLQRLVNELRNRIDALKQSRRDAILEHRSKELKVKEFLSELSEFLINDFGDPAEEKGVVEDGMSLTFEHIQKVIDLAQ